MNPLLLKKSSFDTDFEVQDSSESGIEATFRGYISVHETPDLVGHIATKGMFTKSFNEQSGKVPIFWNHQNLMPAIGETTEFFEDKKGFGVEGFLLPTTMGHDVAVAMKAKVIRKMSYGFYIVKAKPDKGFLRLLEVDTVEVSPTNTNFSVNPDADILECKSLMRSMASEYQVKSIWEFSDLLYRIPSALNIIINPKEINDSARVLLTDAQTKLLKLSQDLDQLLKETEGKEPENPIITEEMSNRLMTLISQRLVCADGY